MRFVKSDSGVNLRRATCLHVFFFAGDEAFEIEFAAVKVRSPCALELLSFQHCSRRSWKEKTMKISFIQVLTCYVTTVLHYE